MHIHRHRSWSVCGSRARLLLLAAFGLHMASACASANPTCKTPTAVELEIEPSDRVNRDPDGRSLPTVLRLYQVRDLSRVQMASSEDMYETPTEALGDTLVATDELTVYPGQVMVRRFERDEKADFLLGVAIFRSPVGSSWRTMQEFPLPGDPCQERDDPKASRKVTDLRVRMFLEDYRLESVADFRGMPRRSCAVGDTRCDIGAGTAPDELPEELRHRRLRTFEEDSSRPKPTVGGE